MKFINLDATPTRRRQIIIGTIVAISILLVLGIIKFIQVRQAIAQHASFQMPPEAVTTVKATEQDWPELFEATADIAPTQGVTLKNEIVGTIDTIHVKAGDVVAKGQPLITLSTSVEQAELDGAEAQLVRADQALRRALRLNAERALSQDALDEARAAFTKSKSAVDILKATIAKKQIVAPFAGTVGVRSVNIGQYVEAGTELMPLQSTSTLFLNFSVPQRALTQIAPGAEISFTVDAFPNKVFKATLETINPQIEMTTRLIKLQATYVNTDQALKPGMFAAVALQGITSNRYITLPATSVQYTPYATTVYVVQSATTPEGVEQKTAASVPVKLAGRRGDQIAIASGLTAGQEVITSGVFKVRAGSPVLPNPEFKVGESAFPTPQDT